MSNVFAFAVVADNFDAKRSIARRIGSDFVICHIHWLNLYVQDNIN